MKRINLDTIDKKFVLSVGVIFFLFVAILFVSYTYKLGYLDLATSLLLGVIPVLLLLNFWKSRPIGKCFWAMLFAAFLFVIADKTYRIHNKLSRYLKDVVPFDPIIFVNVLYLVIFIIILLFFINWLSEEFANHPTWILLFLGAVLLKGVAILADVAFHDITEDYFELFSLYYFASAFISKLFQK